MAISDELRCHDLFKDKGFGITVQNLRQVWKRLKRMVKTSYGDSSNLSKRTEGEDADVMDEVELIVSATNVVFRVYNL